MIRKSINKRTFVIKSAVALVVVSIGILFSPFETSAVIKTERLSSASYLMPDSASRGEFTVMTYNIAGLPEIISSAVTKRAPSISEIGRRLNAFDVVNVQEDFNYHSYLYNSGNSHTFRTRTKGGVPFGDGLNTVSRYPIYGIRRIPWNSRTGADCLTPKGFTYARLEIARNTFIDLYNVHANAYNDLPAAAARRENIKQLSLFISENSMGQAVIVMGDLNAHFNYYYDNLNQLLTHNQLEDAWITLMNRGLLPTPVKGLPASKILLLDSLSESIDKIMFRGNAQIQLSISNYRLETEAFKDPQNNPLSDHHPVSVQFSWKLKGMETENLMATHNVK